MDDKLKPAANPRQQDNVVGKQQAQFEQYKMIPPAPADGGTSSHEHEEKLRQLANSNDVQMRRLAIDQLLKIARVDMTELESWLMDADPDTRAVAFNHVSHGMLHTICEGDKHCAVRLLLKAAHQYQDYYVGRVLSDLSTDSEWLEVIWPEIEAVIDNGDPILMSMFICTFLTKVLPNQNWSPQDPHLQPWITGKFPLRQYTLLKTAAWLTPGNEHLDEVLSALTKAHDSIIAANARAILEGKLTYGDF